MTATINGEPLEVPEREDGLCAKCTAIRLGPPFPRRAFKAKWRVKCEYLGYSTAWHICGYCRKHMREIIIESAAGRNDRCMKVNMELIRGLSGFDEDMEKGVMWMIGHLTMTLSKTSPLFIHDAPQFDTDEEYETHLKDEFGYEEEAIR